MPAAENMTGVATVLKRQPDLPTDFASFVARSARIPLHIKHLGNEPTTLTIQYRFQLIVQATQQATQPKLLFYRRVEVFAEQEHKSSHPIQTWRNTDAPEFPGARRDQRVPVDNPRVWVYRVGPPV